MLALAVLQTLLACAPAVVEPAAPPKVVVEPPEVGNPAKAFKALMDRVARTHQDDLEVCRQSHPRRSGTVMLAFTVKPDGGLAAVRAVDRGDLPGELVGCVIAKVRGWRVPAPRGGGAMQVRYPLVLPPPGPPHAEVRALASGPRIEGSLSSEQIRKVIRAHLKDVQACYEAELRPCPALHSKIVVRFRIVPDGRVDEAEIVQNTSAYHKLGICIAKIVRGWRFPRPQDGSPVTVTYPFIFTAG